MKIFKVYGGLQFLLSVQRRVIVAAKTKKRAAELLGVTSHEFDGHFIETRNDIELKYALAKPQIPLVAVGRMTPDFRFIERDEL